MPPRPADRAAVLLRRLARYPRWLSGGLRALPDFVIIGAQKSGTSSLYAYLAQHPDIAPALEKEVHYFDYNFGRGEAWYRAHFPLAATLRRRERRSGRRQTTGEASPYYLYHPRVPERAAALVPGARLVAVLRDPVYRTQSHYHHEVTRGHETLSFPEALDQEPRRLAGEEERLLRDDRYYGYNHHHYSYQARGEYATQLERWLKHYPRERLLVLAAEELYAQPRETVNRVVEFLGLPPVELPRYRVFNAGDYEPMDPALRERLAARFAPHNERLYALLGRDLGWEKPAGSPDAPSAGAAAGRG
jgi:hypothetical protein